MKGSLSDILEVFRANSRSVLDLLTFDKVLLSIPIQELKNVQTKLKTAKIDNPNLGIDKALTQLENIENRGSLKKFYRDLYNHGLVLLVSYFSSAIGDFFRRALIMQLEDGRNQTLNKTEIKIPLGALRSQEELWDDLGDFVIKQDAISFQDMQSISRACEEYLGFCPVKDAAVNDIIVGQACRHCLVHSGGKIDKKLMGQIKNCLPRSVLIDLNLGQSVEVTIEILESLIRSMDKYISTLNDLLLEKLSETETSPKPKENDVHLRLS